MGTIMQKLEKLLDTKEAIRQAIIAKGQTLPASAAFSAYPGKIAAITTGVTAAAGHILSGKTAYAGGAKVTGSMPNNGAVSKTLDGLTAASVSIPAGYTSGGTVSLTDDIEAALAEI